MKLEELPEIKDGTMAEIEFLKYAEQIPLIVQIPLFRVCYVDRIVSIVPDLSVFFSRSSDFREEKSGEKALKIHNFRRLLNARGQKFEYLSPNYIYLEDILSFRPLKYTQSVRQKCQ